METITSIENYKPQRLLSPGEINKIISELGKLKGIASLNVKKDSVKIEYYQQLISQDFLKKALTKAGFPFGKEKVKRGIFSKFILKLGEENKKEFGGKAPKCCG